MGRINFRDSVQIVDFYHAVEHAGQMLEALNGKGHPDYMKRHKRITWNEDFRRSLEADLVIGKSL